MIIAYFTILALLVASDLAWISLVAGPQYKKQLGGLLREKPRKAAGALFYVFYPAALVYFAILPGIATESLQHVIANGAILGTVGYATFSLTNWAVLTPWSGSLVITDILWGGFLAAASSAAGYFAAT